MSARDYSLTGPCGADAQRNGLADAHWYQSPVDKGAMRALLVRKDWPAIRDTLIWFSLLAVAGYSMVQTWGSAWFLLPFFFYAFLYASVSDSRWHECSHGTAFKTDWMNRALYEVASFMILRESTTWRWSHIRHHTDTIIVGRDPEIASQRPARPLALFLSFFKYPALVTELRRMLIHACGQRDQEAATYVPASEWPAIHWKARVYVAVYVGVVALAIVQQSWLPLMFVGLPSVFGTWLIGLYGYTQHAGLAENVTDHRLNSRTVLMNPLNRFLYWNMNYHVEHHMYPLVPYHALPALHALVKDDCPPAYDGLWAAWKEILAAWKRQIKDPDYFVRRPLPAPATPAPASEALAVGHDGWVCAGNADQIQNADVLRIDAAGHTYAIYRNQAGDLFATEGICTHGNAHLAEGLVIGDEIECPKHNGRFALSDGHATRAPACVALERYPVEQRGEKLWLNTAPYPRIDSIRRWSLRVVAVRNLSTFIREIELEPQQLVPKFNYQPGDYLRICVPAYQSLNLNPAQQQGSQSQIWQSLGLHTAKAFNRQPCMRNYSLATNPVKDERLVLNVRLAFNPSAPELHLGVGSGYMYSLSEGDVIEAVGPQGEFRIKHTRAEKIYIGGGAGMAPLKSHLSYLLETEQVSQPIRFWYGARNHQEALYQDYFEQLAQKYPNFRFNLVLSEPESEQDARYPNGFVHQVVEQDFLSKGSDCQQYEFYLCGPPPMMAATRNLLQKLGVPEQQIAFDEF
ncbi:fatty acid desaturase [Simiduia agarivorans]|uniref:Rieske (2Fe-2S) domain-containing protein n=1 Tax=Simiduia agarivorans (strain DSM 21679 / JCM 13881 / BCRC 17597 / SA1) TaxID=1117647 RepID=K4KMP0_SIMAS|nr:fatty acid desaturase [Simiduia agarivorans]AFV00445.1 Rieske (2Fe-2S) domain-containing protein [Simiduia agarivorans SA1 = DSM 21679]